MLTEKEAIAKIVEDVSDSLTKNRILERYWNRRYSSGEKKYQVQLGDVQRQIKEQEEYLAFLDEISKG